MIVADSEVPSYHPGVASLDVDHEQELRDSFLALLHGATKGNTNAWIEVSRIAEPMGLDEATSHRVITYLRNEGLAGWHGPKGTVITHAGIRVAEAQSLALSRSRRFGFLKALHDACDGKVLTFRNVWRLGEGLGLAEADIRKVKLNLEQGGLIKMGLYGDDACLTAEGIRAIEEEFGMAKSSSPNISVAIGSVHGGQVMVASDGSTQTLTQTAGIDLKELGPFLAQVAASLNKLGLSADDRQAVEADIQTAEAQLKSSKPRTSLLRDVLVSIREALVKAAGTAAVSYAQAELPKLVDQAQHLLAGLGG